MALGGLIVVVPAWNEEDAIGDVVRGILPHGAVLVVDDRSTDRTADRAREAGASVVAHGRNGGYDAALRTGYAEARARGAGVVATMDADGAHDPAMLPRMLSTLEQGADLVVGERPFRQRWSEDVFASWTRLRWGVRDPLCGMKAYGPAVLERFAEFDRYGSVGTDLMLRAARSGMRVVSLPVPCRERVGTVSRFGVGWNANKRILRAMWAGMRTPPGRPRSGIRMQETAP